MHKQRIYIDTSVIGGCFDEEFAEWSNKLFDEFIAGNKIAVISDITIEELEEAPIYVKKRIEDIPAYYKEMIIFDEETDILALLYIENGVITSKFKEDAQHIALSTINNIDILVSWNFKHIVNIERIRNYNSINIKYGYKSLEIRTPREVVYERE